LYDLYVVVPVCCVLAVTVALLLRQRTGLAPDSVTYIDAAQRLLDRQGISHRWAYWDPVYETGIPTATTMWPPGYSLTLAALSRLGLDLVSAGRIASLIAFVLLPIPIFLLLSRTIPPAKAAIGAVLACSAAPIVQAATDVASESMFLLAATCSVFLAAVAVSSKSPSRRTLVWCCASTCAGLAFFLRYVGLACAVSLPLLSAGASRRRIGSISIAEVASATVPSAAFIAPIFARNYLVSGTIGQPWAGADVFWGTLGSGLQAVVTSVGGSPNNSWWSALFLLIEASTLCILVSKTLRNCLIAFCGRTSASRFPTLDALVVGTFVFCYLLLVFIATWARGVNLEARYVTIIWPWCATLLCVCTLGRVGRDGSDGVTVRERSLVLVSCVTLLACLFMVTIRQSLQRTETYVSSKSPGPTVSWVREHVARDEVILTTRGAQLALWCPNPIIRVPRRPHSAHGATSIEDVASLARRFGARYCVHFPGFPTEAKFSDAEFKFVRALDGPASIPEWTAHQFSDGIVYELPSVADAVHRHAQP